MCHEAIAAGEIPLNDIPILIVPQSKPEVEDNLQVLVPHVTIQL